VTVDVGADGHDEFFQVAEDAAPEPILRQVAEERSTMFSHDALVGVKCRWKARVPRQPALHFGVLMGGVVIADQVKLPVGQDGLVDEAENLSHSWWRCRSWHRPKTSPLAVFSAANKVAVPLRL